MSEKYPKCIYLIPRGPCKVSTLFHMSFTFVCRHVRSPCGCHLTVLPENDDLLPSVNNRTNHSNACPPLIPINEEVRLICDSFAFGVFWVLSPSSLSLLCVCAILVICSHHGVIYSSLSSFFLLCVCAIIAICSQHEDFCSQLLGWSEKPARLFLWQART